LKEKKRKIAKKKTRKKAKKRGKREEKWGGGQRGKNREEGDRFRGLEERSVETEEGWTSY